MGRRQVVQVCAVVLMMAGQAWSAAAASGIGGLAVCGAAPRPESNAASPRTQPAAKTGTIPGLGHVAASLDWDRRHEITLTRGDIQVTRTYTPLTRQVEIIIAGADEQPVEIRLGGVDGFSITRGAQVLRGTSDPDALRALIGGRAGSAFRELIGTYERRLMAGGRSARLDDAHADGFLLAGAFVGALAGDPNAVGRARDLITGRIRARFRSVRFEFKDCVRDYEQYLLMIDSQRTSCLEAANSRDSWYVRAADRLGCE